MICDQCGAPARFTLTAAYRAERLSQTGHASVKHYPAPMLRACSGGCIEAFIHQDQKMPAASSMYLLQVLPTCTTPPEVEP